MKVGARQKARAAFPDKTICSPAGWLQLWANPLRSRKFSARRLLLGFSCRRQSIHYLARGNARRSRDEPPDPRRGSRASSCRRRPPSVGFLRRGRLSRSLEDFAPPPPPLPTNEAPASRRKPPRQSALICSRVARIQMGRPLEDSPGRLQVVGERDGPSGSLNGPGSGAAESRACWSGGAGLRSGRDNGHLRSGRRRRRLRAPIHQKLIPERD